MIKKAINIAAAAGFAAAAAGVVAVSIAYAIFALARMSLNAAGSAAVVAGVFALILGIAFLYFRSKGRVDEQKPEPTMAEKAMEFVRQRPVVSAVGLIAASVVMFRNPALVASLVAGAMAQKAESKSKR